MQADPTANLWVQIKNIETCDAMSQQTWLKQVCAVGRRSKRSLLWIWNRWGPCIPCREWQQKQERTAQILKTWRAENPSRGTFDVPVTNWTSCDKHGMSHHKTRNNYGRRIQFRNTNKLVSKNIEGRRLTLAVSSSLISATHLQNHWIWGESRV